MLEEFCRFNLNFDDVSLCKFDRIFYLFGDSFLKTWQSSAKKLFATMESGENAIKFKNNSLKLIKNIDLLKGGGCYVSIFQVDIVLRLLTFFSNNSL